MDRTKITENYMTAYSSITEQYAKEKIPNLIEEINSAISRSDTKHINTVYEKISIWNNSVSNLQGNRDTLMSHDKTLRLPSVKEFLIIYDHINKEWRFNTEAD